MFRRPLHAFPLALALLLSGGAFAHQADVVYVQAVRAPDGGQVAERMTMTAPSLALLAPVDRDRDGALSAAELSQSREAIAAGVWAQSPLSAGTAPCALLSHQVAVKEGYVELQAHFECGAGGGELQQTFRFLSVLPEGYRVVVGSFEGGERYEQFAEGSRQTLFFAGPTRPASPGLVGWVKLGVHHIFTGYDHLAFLFALLLLGAGWRRTLLLVSAFTLAHSLTLGLTVFRLVEISARAAVWVEVAIALSIVYVAAENLLMTRHGHRPLVTFGFGLVHGFGFAAVLRSYGLEDGVASALFGFNVGVELGQAAVVLLVWPLLRLLMKDPARGKGIVRVLSVALVALGSFWVVDRLLG